MFKLQIDTGNDAFSDSAKEEIVRILKEKVIPLLEQGVVSSSLRDINGNKVGEFNLR
jgi:hypothetical protein